MLFAICFDFSRQFGFKPTQFFRKVRARIHNDKLTLSHAIQNFHVFVIRITDRQFSTFRFATNGDVRKVMPGR